MISTMISIIISIIIILSKIKSDYYQIGFLMLKEINECENKVSRESYYNPKLSSK